MQKILLVLILLFPFISSAKQEKLPEDSVYQIESKWFTHENKPISLKELAGQGVIITMVYTGCAHACPMTIAKAQEVEQAFLKKGIKNFKLVLASFDWEQDTPEALKKYLKSRKLDENRWILLSAPQESVARELAVVLGISFKSLGNGDFSHSNVISYLDEKGVLRAKIESLTADVTPLVEGADKNKK